MVALLVPYSLSYARLEIRAFHGRQGADGSGSGGRQRDNRSMVHSRQGGCTVKKILVAVDFSPASEQAVRTALQLGEKFESKLLLLHVIHDPANAPGFYAAKKAGKKVLRNMEAAAAEMMVEFVAKHVKDWEAFETRILPGLPADELLRAARNYKADLIIMGTRGHGALRRLMVGSVTDKVIRSCTRPVLVVQEEKKPRK